MRGSLRRLLWLIPMLVVVTVLAFGALSKSLEEFTPGSPGALGDRTLPLFFNTAPETVADVAWGAARRVAENASDEKAKARLLALGAAALPHVLPRIDALPPSGRSHVAEALVPLALRMRIAAPGDFDAPGRALEFWDGYWQDHIADFRPTAIRRVVRRFSERATPQRQRELIQFDTFALPEIMAQLDESIERGDLEAQRRLCSAAAHATDMPGWVVAENAGPAALAEVVARWQGWWSLQRTNYQTPEGFERILAPILQTRYALWAQAAARTRFGFTRDNQPALTVLLAQAPVTLALLSSGLLGGTLIGVLLGTLVSASRIRWLMALEGGTSLVWLAIPTALVTATVLPALPAFRFWIGLFLMLLLGSALVAQYQRSTMEATLKTDWVRTYRAMGASRLKLARVTLRASSGAAISTLAPHTSTLLTSAFVIEYAFGMNGVGRQTIRALHDRDVVWLMLVTLATAALVGLVQILSDLLLRGLDPQRAEPDQAVEVSVG